MIFIFISWLLILLTFAIWMRALHTIPIYTYTTEQAQTQKNQLHTLWRLTQWMLCISLVVLFLHFEVPEEEQAAHHVVKASYNHTDFVSESNETLF
jgi:Fic family protein